MRTDGMIFDVYEDNAGRLYGYASRGGEVVWSKLYGCDGQESMAAADFAAFVNGADPVADCWDDDKLDAAETEALDLIASTAWFSGDFESMFDYRHAGIAGKGFIRLLAPELELS